MNTKSVRFFARVLYKNILNGKISFKKLRALMGNLFFALLRVPRVKYGPVAMWVEAANFCNLACRDCWVPPLSKKLTPGEMDFTLYKKLIDETRETMILVMLQMSGESFLNKNILEMMSYADERKVIIWISTNGSFHTSDDWGEKIVKTGIDTLYFSISGTNQEEYGKYHRKGRLSYVEKNIKKIQDAKKKLGSKTPYLYARMLIADKNASLKNIRKFVKKLGIGLHIRYVRLKYFFKGLEDKTKTKIRVSSSKQKSKVHNHCLGLWLAAAVQSNGAVLPCCLNHMGIPTLGNVNKTSFNAIWKGNEFNKFRQSILSSRKDLNGCAYCDNSLGFRDAFSKEERNIYINFY